MKGLASVPYELNVDASGNQVMHFGIESLPPYGSKEIRITAELHLAQSPQPLSVPDLDLYLRDERYVEVDHAAIVSEAKKIDGAEDMALGRNIYDWVSGSLRYTGYQQRDYGALHALNNKRGDCTEYMYLFMALARNKGIPARGVAGYVYAKDAILRPMDHHNWAEFYAEGAWHLVDAQKKVFDKNQSNYIAMRILGEASVNAASNAHRFWYWGDGLEVRMN